MSKVPDPIHRRELTVVCIDDEADHAELLRLALDRVADLEVRFLAERTVDDALDTLHRHPVDLVFLDYQLGSARGTDVLMRLRAAHFTKPVVMLTAHGNEYVAASAIRAGADDYLVKSDLDPEVLSQVLTRAEANARQRTEASAALARALRLEEMSQALAEAAAFWAERARHDSLTGLLTRTAWEEASAREVERALRFGHSVAVCLVDVDEFKSVNDRAGHLAGDRCLEEIARALLGACRTIDSVGRFGGDELVVLLPETTLDGALALAERAREAVQTREVRLVGAPAALLRISVSIGVAAGLPASWQELIAEADRALYEAKRAGRNRVHGRLLGGGSAPTHG